MAVTHQAVRRIGLLGGSFDPVHLAHLSLARCAIAQLQLDELRCLPAGQPWQKSGRVVTAAVHRRAMVELLMAGEPQVLLDDRELRREGPSYTIDTVRELLAEHPGAELFLIIGADQYAAFSSWREWPALLERVTLAVAGRAGHAPQPPLELKGQVHRVQFIAMPESAISSTQVREQASRGEDIRPMVGDAVAGYIALHRLYSEQ
jgi:nicotinate-nucleotide adenylyltransferase